MFIPFENLSDNSRIWIYQTENRISPNLEAAILDKTKQFIDSWQSHGNNLKGSVKLFYNHFLVLAIDEDFSSASGCSIDKSVHFVQELETALDLTFLNRNLQAYLDQGEIKFFAISEAKKLTAQSIISPTTEVFNNSITALAQLKTEWIQPADKSWMRRFFKQVQLG